LFKKEEKGRGRYHGQKKANLPCLRKGREKKKERFFACGRGRGNRCLWLKGRDAKRKDSLLLQKRKGGRTVTYFAEKEKGRLAAPYEKGMWAKGEGFTICTRRGGEG